MSRRHNLAVYSRVFEQVTKISPSAWRLQRVSISLLRFCPLLEVGLQVHFTQVVTATFQPALDLPKKRAAHLHAVFDPAARIAILIHVKQIGPVQPVFSKIFFY